MAVDVRARAGGDLDSCENLARVVHRTDGYPPRLAGDLRDFIASADAIGAWVAEHAQGIVGHVALHHTNSPEVKALAAKATGRPADALAVAAWLLVAPSYRRRGVARSLLSIAAEEAVCRGLRPLLDVATHFESAIQLYEGAGWSRAGTVTVPIPGAASLDEFV